MAIVSSHALNGADGTHAGGIPVRLSNLTRDRLLFQVQMDSGGRLSEAVDLADAEPTDRYEITFDVGTYWTSRGLADPHTLTEIVLRFSMPQPDARYHMPIIVAPNGYSGWISAPE